MQNTRSPLHFSSGGCSTPTDRRQRIHPVSSRSSSPNARLHDDGDDEAELWRARMRVRLGAEKEAKEGSVSFAGQGESVPGKHPLPTLLPFYFSLPERVQSLTTKSHEREKKVRENIKEAARLK